MNNKYICIHGHFYQPPRENAWLEEIELQDSAHPFHDWNERIAYECYGPNTASRILNAEGKIIEITNNYSRINFNFGPTLLSWMEAKDNEFYRGILEADKMSMSRFGGHGSAMAQVYNHIIMPLANRRDKETQVIWGIKDFESRFNRQPEGMWLAETAVDIETLEVLASNGIKFTVLAPRQGQNYKLFGEDQWRNGIDTRLPYRYILPSGKEIYLYFYDGDLSQAVAFNGLLDNGLHFADRLLGAFTKPKDEMELVHIATDGESYGHHHKHGDMALAFCLEHIDQHKQANLTNYGQFLEITNQFGECNIHERSSWSCVHGVERWKDDCGCDSGGHGDWNQKWRKPLRESLDWLRDELNKSFESKAVDVLNDPWDARNQYIDVILDRQARNISNYLNEHPSDNNLVIKGMRWLEMQRNALLMYTSCGWFFDEVSGLETTQILQYACRAMQIHYQLTKIDLEPEFLSMLEQAPSNLPEFANAKGVYEKYVIPTRLDLERVGMHFAVASLFEKDSEAIKIFNYSATNVTCERREGGIQKFICGVTNIRSKVTFSQRQFTYAVLYLGQHNIIGNISLDMAPETYIEMRNQLCVSFEESRVGDLIGLMQTFFGPKKFTMWHLFRDQKRKVINQLLEENLRQVENSFRKIYNRDYPMINMLKSSEIPIPRPYVATLEYVLNADLRKCLQGDKIDLDELERLAHEFSKWGVSVQDDKAVEKHASERIYRSMKKLFKYADEIDRIIRINRFFEYLKIFNLTPDISHSQNVYFYLYGIHKKNGKIHNKEWFDVFTLLGKHLQISVE